MSTAFERMIVFENESFIVMDKPAGWLSVAGRGAKESHCLLHYMTEVRGVQFWPVHRLDQPVSGLLVYAKTAAAHRLANTWFEGQVIGKRYEALTEGEKFPVVGTPFHWKNKLLRGKKRAYEHEIGKLALTDAIFSSEQAIGGLVAGHWILLPKTGRSHQLRFQLFKAGFPIWGDNLYGAKNPVEGGGILLRSTQLDFSAIPGERLGIAEHLETFGIVDWLTRKGSEKTPGPAQT